MKLTTSSRYGLRALVDLALHESGGPVALRDVARRQRVSESYLEQAFASLKRAGFLRGVRGAQGGYQLARDPSGITAGEVLRALEGDLSIVDDGPADLNADPVKRCIKALVWDAIDAEITRQVDSVTVAGLAAGVLRMRGDALK